MVLALIKFAMVAAYFMHLKFDSPLLRRLFITGIVLAGVVYTVALVTLRRPGLTRSTLPYAWHAHPDVWLLVAVLVGGYVWALRRLGPRHTAPGQPVATRPRRSAGCRAWSPCGWPPTGRSTTWRRATSTACT